jgi:hypothetical protein
VSRWSYREPSVVSLLANSTRIWEASPTKRNVVLRWGLFTWLHETVHGLVENLIPDKKTNEQTTFSLAPFRQGYFFLNLSVAYRQVRLWLGQCLSASSLIV